MAKQFNRNKFRNNRDDVPVNFGIRAREVICIDPDGENLGILPRNDAIDKAKALELDLVKVSSGKDGTPICRMLNYGKFKYEKSKKDKEVSKKQRQSQKKLKEIKLRPSTDINDLKIKASRANAFLEEGDNVKVSIVFRGREITHKDVGIDTLSKFIKLIPNVQLNNEPVLQGKVLSILIDGKKEQAA